ncbi:ABC transporter permease [Ruminococcaceae bacterium BL-6]|jgi:putative ABC transport system permease protein|nr:ABC transporter permease [Ruminococcaceae bacterium BL-6]
MNIVNLLGAVHGALAQGILWGIMTLGVYITFRVLNFADLSVDGSFATGGAISAVLTESGTDPFLTLLAALAGGMACGFLTGFLNTKMKIPGILAGILTMTALYSINLRIMKSRANIPLLGVDTVDIRVENLLPGVSKYNCQIILGGVIAAAVVALIYWFFGTETGCAIRATGNNPHMVRSLGVNTDTTTILALVISNGLVALSGALVAQTQGFGDVSMGIGTIVIGLASVIIGEVLLGRRVNFIARLIAMLGGSVVYRVIIAVVLFLGLKSQDMKLLSSIVVAIALFFPTAKKRAGRYFSRRPALVPDSAVEDAIDDSDKDPDEAAAGKE